MPSLYLPRKHYVSVYMCLCLTVGPVEKSSHVKLMDKIPPWGNACTLTLLSEQCSVQSSFSYCCQRIYYLVMLAMEKHVLRIDTQTDRQTDRLASTHAHTHTHTHSHTQTNYSNYNGSSYAWCPLMAACIMVVYARIMMAVCIYPWWQYADGSTYDGSMHGWWQYVWW